MNFGNLNKVKQLLSSQGDEMIDVKVKGHLLALHSIIQSTEMYWELTGCPALCEVPGIRPVHDSGYPCKHLRVVP